MKNNFNKCFFNFYEIFGGLIVKKLCSFIFILGLIFSCNSMKKQLTWEEAVNHCESSIKGKKAKWDSDRRQKEELPDLEIKKLHRETFDSYVGRLHLIANFLAWQDRLIVSVASLRWAVQDNLRLVDFFNKHFSWLSKRRDSDGDYSYEVDIKDSPELKSINLILENADRKNLSIVQRIRLLDFLISRVADKQLQAALYIKKTDCYKDLADEYKEEAVRLFSMMPEVDMNSLIDCIREYCYPACAYFILMDISRLKEGVVHNVFSEDKYASACDRLVKFYKDLKPKFDKLYESSIEKFSRLTQDNPEKRKSWFFKGEDLLSHLLSFEDPDKKIPHEKIEKEESCIEKTEKITKIGKKKRYSRKKKGKKKSLVFKEESEKDDAENVLCEDLSSISIASESDEFNLNFDFPRSEPIFQDYDFRVLDWHNDEEEAFKRQGYCDPANPKSLLPKKETIIRHRLPFCIEQEFRHLAIENDYHKKGRDYRVLNFPGAIKIPGEEMLIGYFAIAYNKETQTVIHRFFHDKNEQDLKEAIDKGRPFLEQPEEVLIEEDEKKAMSSSEEYTIIENMFLIKITDKFGVEYILFKGHKI